MYWLCFLKGETGTKIRLNYEQHMKYMYPMKIIYGLVHHTSPHYTLHLLESQSNIQSEMNTISKSSKTQMAKINCSKIFDKHSNDELGDDQNMIQANASTHFFLPKKVH